MRKRFQMLVCAAAFTAAAGLCTLPLTAFAADAAVLLPDESAPIVEVVLEPLTPAAEETEPAEPEEREPAAEPAEPETDLPEAPGIVTLPAEGIVVVPTAAEDTVDIDVSWGAMEFTYTAAWDPSTLAYDPGSWTASGNTVTVDKNGIEMTIAQSGLLQPGSALTRLDLDTEVNLPAGSYDGYFSLGFYDPASNEKATVDSHIDGLTIHVS